MKSSTRLLAGIMIAAGGLIHLDLWRHGYRGIPYVGPLFLLNIAASAVVAVAVVASGDRRVTLAAGTLAVGSLVGLVLSRTTGLLGFTEVRWTTEAVRAISAEVGALVALGLAWAGARRPVLVPVLSAATGRRAPADRGR